LKKSTPTTTTKEKLTTTTTTTKEKPTTTKEKPTTTKKHHSKPTTTKEKDPKPTHGSGDNDWDYDDGQVTFFTPNQGACGEWNDDNDFIAALVSPPPKLKRNPDSSFFLLLSRAAIFMATWMKKANCVVKRSSSKVPRGMKSPSPYEMHAHLVMLIILIFPPRK
jgi:hypothetical protein